MKRISFIALLVISLVARGQGEIYFAAHLMNTNIAYTGDGSFSLSGTNIFTYDVQTYLWPISPYAQIRSPWGNSNTLFVLDLVPVGFSPGIGGSPWFGYFQGTTTLSEQQVSELQRGELFVFTSFSNDPTRPYLQGQILPVTVPEPSTYALFCMGLVSLLFLRTRRS